MSGFGQGYLEPLVEVKETGKEIVIYADLPFVDGPENISVELLEDDELEITATMRKSIRWDRWGAHQRSMTFSQYKTRIRLPAEVDAEGARATFKNGILTVVLPKRASKVRVNVE
ncbi:MAG: Hsp20/alpha crystallin family protein [Nitrososphaeria archaeon]